MELLITRLKTGNQAGLKKGGDLEPLYGFPTGHKSTRLLYIKKSMRQSNNRQKDISRLMRTQRKQRQDKFRTSQPKSYKTFSVKKPVAKA